MIKCDLSADVSNIDNLDFNDFYCDCLDYSDYLNETNNSNEIYELNENNYYFDDEINKKEKKIFAEYEIYTKDNVFVGRISKKRLEWYMKKRNYLFFDPENKILTLDENYDVTKTALKKHDIRVEFGKKENVCISCGTIYDLIKIRIIPHSITKLLPSEHKTGQENILAICIDCNTESSNIMENYKKSIYDKYGVNLNKTIELNKLLIDYNTAIACTNNPAKYFYPNKKTKTKYYLKKSLDGRIKQTYDIHTVFDDHISRFIIDTKKILDENGINYYDDVTNHTLISKITDFKKFKKEWIIFFFNNVNTDFLSESVKQYYKKIIESND